jgi:chemotaxis response regulator CheB
VSNLSIGLVSSEDQESKTLVRLLQEQGINVAYHLTPEEISSEHAESTEINVWLLSVDDDHWHDNIDILLDESDASVYFNEPGSLSKEEHLEYWCRNLVSRLYEVSGLEKQIENEKSERQQSASSELEINFSETIKLKAIKESNEVLDLSELGTIEPNAIEPDAIEPHASISILDSALDELQTTSVGLPSDIAAELVSELEYISPQLDSFQLHSLQQEASLNDEIQVESIEVEPEDDFNISNDIVFDNVLQEAIDLDDEELSTEETLDFLDAAIISHEKNTDEKLELDDAKKEFEIDNQYFNMSEIETNIEDGKDKIDINQYQLEPNKRDNIEDIDFSNLSIPVLESTRNDDLISNHSEYSLEEAEPESYCDDIALATTKEYQDAHEIKLQEHQADEESALELHSDLSIEHLSSGSKTVEKTLKEQGNEDLFVNEIDLEGINIDFSLEGDEGPLSQGKADFNIEDDDFLETEIVKQSENDRIQIVNEKLEHSGLSLESEKEAVKDCSNFLTDDVFDKEIDPQEEFQNDEHSQSSLIATEEKSLGLSLETTEQVITGRAVFIDEEDDELVNNSTQEENNSLLDEALENVVLSLESDEPITGKALFEIDKIDKIVDLDVAESVGQEVINKSDLILEDNDVIETLNSPQTISETINFDINAYAEDVAESSADAKSNSVSLNPEELSFEIPMLEDAATDIDFQTDDEKSMTSSLTPCWIIGASLGGPAAVKRFMHNIPADINACFIVVQHIDESFLPVLANILTTNSHFEVKVASGRNVLTPGSVFLAPLKGKLTFLRDGSMLVDHSQSWSAPYSPCIDDVIESISTVYTDKCGAIIFSGMGQDGFQGAKKLAAVNGEIWAQSVETCANASMPQAIINAGLAKVVATPEMLAERLVKKLYNV